MSARDIKTSNAPEPMVYVSTAKRKLPLTPEELANLDKPKVLIVGAGIGGITLGILLKKAGIDFTIYERAKEVKPLGSAISIGATVYPLFRQLGIWDEFQALGKPLNLIHIFKEDLQPNFTMDWSERTTLAGEQEYIISRPELYELLLRQIAKENIQMGKKVMSFEQNNEGVMIRCSDNTAYHGDILVGADGAYSGVRQHLFKALKKKKQLPASDDVPLPFSTVCLVGQTEELNLEEFPDLKKEEAQFLCVFGPSSKYSRSSKENDSFRNSEWGPEAAEAMCKEVRHFKVPGGKDGKDLTLGDFIDRTPKGFVSKVMLEEKVFDTWYGGRTVLLGDACHKFSPSGAAGALTAMHDAIALANWIAALESKDMIDLNLMFKEYHAERYPIAKDTFVRSQMFNKVLGKNLQAKFTRIVMKRIPPWLQRKIVIKMTETRPQVSFLPLVEDKGTVKPIYQASLQKTLAILKRRAANEKDAPGAVAV
ncbi:hypothetical protein BG000_010558 [Podila horticola]|nr:hypothetical protein BG000_010558 [Podila horticola]